MRYEVISKYHCSLGESPYWHQSSKSFFWVDINKGILYSYKISSKKIKRYQFNHKLSLVTEAHDGKLILALDLRIASFDLFSEKIEWITELKNEKLVDRFNDGKCDLNGNLWIGTINNELKSRAGSLYCISSDLKFKKKLTNISVSNGIAWTSNYRKMYFIDSPTQEIKAYNFNQQKNQIEFQKVVIKVPFELGTPDGMSIDKNGNLWIAHYGGYGIYCWSPKTGKIIDRIKLPARDITSCCFGGENLNYLLVTSATQSLSKKNLIESPHSGHTFLIKLDVEGILPNKFVYI